MRPLALALILVSLTGCMSVQYEGKVFKAVPKHEFTASEEHAGGHEGGEHGAEAHPGGENPEEHGSEHATEAVFEHTEPVVATSHAFPKTAQPTGRPPVMVEREYTNAEQSALKMGE